MFPASQIHYCFFEDLRDKPEALTSDLLSFLGVEPVPPAPVQLPQAVNVAAGSKPIPIEFSREMAARLSAHGRRSLPAFRWTSASLAGAL